MTSEQALLLQQAHQYLYYVRCAPVWTDFQYDLFCKEAGLEPGGGSDGAEDYSKEARRLADSLLPCES